MLGFVPLQNVEASQAVSGHIENVVFQQERINYTIKCFSRLIDVQLLRIRHARQVLTTGGTKSDERSLQNVKEQELILSDMLNAKDQNDRQRVDDELFQKLKDAFGVQKIATEEHPKTLEELENSEDLISSATSYSVSFDPDTAWNAQNNLTMTYHDKVLEKDFDSHAGRTIAEKNEIAQRKTAKNEDDGDKQIELNNLIASLRDGDIDSVKRALEKNTPKSTFTKQELLRYRVLDETVRKSYPRLYRVNDPIRDEKIVTVHRMLVDPPKTLYVNEDGEHTSIACFKTLFTHYHTLLGNRYQMIPELDGADFDDERSLVYPQPPNDIPLFSIHDTSNEPRAPSIQQFEQLVKEYMPYLYAKKIEWTNSIRERADLVYELVNYFSVEPDVTTPVHVSPEEVTKENMRWDQVRLRQFPVVIKRNGQYALVFGIRWGHFRNVQPEIDRMKTSGLYGLTIDRNHFNNYPYFKESGEEQVNTLVVPSTRYINEKEKTKRKLEIERDEIDAPALVDWNEDFIGLDELSIPKSLRRGILHGSRDPRIEQLATNPLRQLAGFVPAEPIRRERHVPSSLPDKTIMNQLFGKSQSNINIITDHVDYNQALDAIPTLLQDKDFRMLFIPSSEHVHPSSKEYDAYIGKIRLLLTELFPHAFNYIMETATDLDIIKIISNMQERVIGTIDKETLEYNPLTNVASRACKHIAQGSKITNKKLQFIMDLIGEIPNHRKQEEPRKTIFDRMPELIDSIRDNVTQRRHSKQNFELFLRGILVPDQPHIHKKFVEHEIAEFLNILPEYFYDRVTLISRFMNLKWNKPLKYARVLVPTSREVIFKFSYCYRNVLERVLESRRSIEVPETIVADTISVTGLDQLVDTIVGGGSEAIISQLGKILLPLYNGGSRGTVDDFKRCALYIIEYELAAKEIKQDKIPDRYALVNEYYTYMNSNQSTGTNTIRDIAKRIVTKYKATVVEIETKDKLPTVQEPFYLKSRSKSLLSLLDQVDTNPNLFYSYNFIQEIQHPNNTSQYRKLNPKEIAFEEYRQRNSHRFVTSSLPVDSNAYEQVDVIVPEDVKPTLERIVQRIVPPLPTPPSM
jgi:hypothetical protein